MFLNSIQITIHHYYNFPFILITNIYQYNLCIQNYLNSNYNIMMTHYQHLMKLKKLQELPISTIDKYNTFITYLPQYPH